ncbi:MAG TPA: sulfotransferase [Phenylobacterium sp.]
MPPNAPGPRVSPVVAAHLARAGQLRKAGRMADALGPLLAAVKLEPRNAILHHDVGLTYLALGRPREAAAAFRQAIAILPFYANAHWRLAVTLEQLQATEAAIVAYQKAVEYEPSLSDAEFRLAILLDNAGQKVEATRRFWHVESTARSPELKAVARARGLLGENRHPEAISALKDTIAKAPDDARALNLLGNALSETGDFPAAWTAYDQALRIQPRFVGSYYDMVRCRKVTAEDGVVERMLEGRALPGLTDMAQIRVNLALGKAYDDLGQYEQAMAAFDAADAVHVRAVKFSLAEFEAQADRIIARFTPEAIARAREFGSGDRTPAFVVGMPRSGTTLTEQILSSHPEVTGAGELPFWPKRGEMFEAAGEAGLERAFTAQSADHYLKYIRAIAPDAPRVTDKMPFNFLWVGLIHVAFPQAAILHCRRSPIDTALSIHQIFFSPNFKFPTGGADLVGYYHVYERVMDHWRAVIPADRFVDVDYDTLTADPEPLARRMVAALGLPWNEACLHPEANDRVVQTPSKWQAKQPINRGAIDRWRRYAPWLGPLSELLTDAQRLEAGA